MSSVNNPKLVKQIRGIIKGEYDYWLTYNDPLVDGRKIKCMSNGYMAPTAELNSTKQAIVAKLEAAGIEFKSAGWEDCSSYRGPYRAFVVRI